MGSITTDKIPRGSKVRLFVPVSEDFSAYQDKRFVAVIVGKKKPKRLTYGGRKLILFRLESESLTRDVDQLTKYLSMYSKKNPTLKLHGAWPVGAPLNYTFNRLIHLPITWHVGTVTNND